MNKFLIIVLIIITGCGVGFVVDLRESDLRDSKNIIYNSGFEKGRYVFSATPEGWIILDKPLHRIVWDNEAAHNGGKSLKIKFPDNKIVLISEAFSLNPEAVYHTRCFVKSQNNGSKPITFLFNAFDKNGKKVNSFSKKITSKQSWTSLEMNTGFLKSSAKFGRISLIFPSDGKNIYWVDDIESYLIHSFHKRK